MGRDFDVYVGGRSISYAPSFLVVILLILVAAKSDKQGQDPYSRTVLYSRNGHKDPSYRNLLHLGLFSIQEAI